MKWTQEYVWEKIESIIPNAAISELALPEALNCAALGLFLLDETEDDGSYRAYVIKTCIEELRSQGWLTFGDKDEDWL
jgi:hypothetical protein